MENVHSDYSFGGQDGHRCTADVTAFAHRPLDARTACLTVGRLDDPHNAEATASRLQMTGAPILFLVSDQQTHVWRGGVRPEFVTILPEHRVDSFLSARADELRPKTVYRAKTRGRFDAAYQLDLVDIGLISLVESRVGDTLSRTFQRALADLRRGRSDETPEQRFVHVQTAFWLLAARVLKDKGVPAFQPVNLREPLAALRQVAEHYHANLPLGLRDPALADRLIQAADVVASVGSLHQVTTESLAYLYDTTLLEPEVRKTLGIHSTPSYLVDYILARLEDSIAELPVDKRRVFEPACGPAGFLVGAMRMLRDLNSNADHTYLRECLYGIEIDQVAFEIARLSLTLADAPHGNGWDLELGDMFDGQRLEVGAAQANILLSNPPFERFDRGEHVTQAAELVARTLPHLPDQAAFGLVLPATLLSSLGEKTLRRQMLRDHTILEICSLPDKVFPHADVETAVVIGRRSPGSSKHVYYRRVREGGIDAFRERFETDAAPRGRQAFEAVQQTNKVDLRWTPLDEVWRHYSTLDTIALVGQGFSYVGRDQRGGTKDEPYWGVAFDRPGSNTRPGVLTWNKGQCSHTAHPIAHLRTDEQLIGRARSGLKTQPKVLFNYAPVSRGAWRLCAILDRAGLVFSSRFVGAIPLTSRISIEALWSILSSPVAAAFVFSLSSKRQVKATDMRAIPIPALDESRVDQLTLEARRYIESPSVPGLLALDRLILDLYAFSHEVESSIVEQLDGHPRVSVPFGFTGYPEDFLDRRNPRKSERGMTANIRWLRQYSDRYPGQWVALDSGRLVASADSLDDVEKILTDYGRTIHRVLLVQVGTRFA